MTFEEYQKQAVSFRTESANNEEYLALGLIAEVGEAAGKLAKRIRDGVFDEKAFIKELGDVLWFAANLAECCGDAGACRALENYFGKNAPSGGVRMPEGLLLRELATYAADAAMGEQDYCHFRHVGRLLACLADKYGYTLEQVAEINIAKLRDRQARGAIKGDGDER